jgi:hypothetical protein
VPKNHADFSFCIRAKRHAFSPRPAVHFRREDGPDLSSRRGPIASPADFDEYYSFEACSSFYFRKHFGFISSALAEIRYRLALAIRFPSARLRSHEKTLCCSTRFLHFRRIAVDGR